MRSEDLSLALLHLRHRNRWLYPRYGLCKVAFHSNVQIPYLCYHRGSRRWEVRRNESSWCRHWSATRWFREQSSTWYRVVRQVRWHEWAGKGGGWREPSIRSTSPLCRLYGPKLSWQGCIIERHRAQRQRWLRRWLSEFRAEANKKRKGYCSSRKLKLPTHEQDGDWITICKQTFKLIRQF